MMARDGFSGKIVSGAIMPCKNNLITVLLSKRVHFYHSALTATYHQKFCMYALLDWYSHTRMSLVYTS